MPSLLWIVISADAILSGSSVRVQHTCRCFHFYISLHYLTPFCEFDILFTSIMHACRAIAINVSLPTTSVACICLQQHSWILTAILIQQSCLSRIASAGDSPTNDVRIPAWKIPDGVCASQCTQSGQHGIYNLFVYFSCKGSSGCRALKCCCHVTSSDADLCQALSCM